MRVLPASDLESTLDYPSLIDRLRDTFRDDSVVTPVRHHHDIAVPNAADATLLLMPAWALTSGNGGGYVGVKVASVYPDNGTVGLPSVMASYLLLNGKTGAPEAVLDGAELTVRRTACASALASRYLSRQDSERLLMVGTGKLAPHLIAAHASQRPLSKVLIWGRTAEKAERLASALDRPGLRVTATTDLEDAARGADIISCATLASAPLIKGAWLQPGQHIDLVGAFKPTMREADDAAMARAAVFVDTIDGATKEAGDIVQALQAGALALDDIRGDLFGLTRGTVAGRNGYNQITLFKSVGTALEDLAAACLAFERS